MIFSVTASFFINVECRKGLLLSLKIKDLLQTFLFLAWNPGLKNLAAACDI